MKDYRLIILGSIIVLPAEAQLMSRCSSRDQAVSLAETLPISLKRGIYPTFPGAYIRSPNRKLEPPLEDSPASCQHFVNTSSL